jgi:hypothetical protein
MPVSGAAADRGRPSTVALDRRRRRLGSEREGDLEIASYAVLDLGLPMRTGDPGGDLRPCGEGRPRDATEPWFGDHDKVRCFENGLSDGVSVAPADQDDGDAVAEGLNGVP